MASKSSGQQKSAWKGFVDCSLTEKQKDTARGENVWTGIDVWLDELLKGGYRVVLSYDVEHDCCVASFTCTDEQSPNSGWTLSGRGPDVQGALQMVCHKHFTILKGDWTTKEAKTASKWG